MVVAILNVGYRSTTNDDAFPSPDGQLGIASEQDHFSNDMAAHRADEGGVMPGESGPPPRAPTPRRTIEPSVPPVADILEKTHMAPRISPALGSLVVALLMLGTVALLAARSSRNARAAAAQTAQATLAPAAEPQSPKPVLPVASASSQLLADEPRNHAGTVDIGKNPPLDTKPVDNVAPPPTPSAQPGFYLRIGLGPSCPEMLAYGKQFVAAAIPDSKVVQLKSGACALVRGPYAADIVQQRRKEHNDRHIRGFDTAVVVDGSDFDKWLLGTGNPI
ncbi:MAG TPA: hypothetical protein VGL13_10310 [Polyangiaceae bacterium]